MLSEAVPPSETTGANAARADTLSEVAADSFVEALNVDAPTVKESDPFAVCSTDATKFAKADEVSDAVADSEIVASITCPTAACAAKGAAANGASANTSYAASRLNA